MKFKINAVAAALALAGLAATGVAQAQFQDRTIRVSNGVNQDHPVGNGIGKMTECLAQKSGGKMNVQIFPGGALGGDLQTLSALRGGTVDATAPSVSINILKSRARGAQRKCSIPVGLIMSEWYAAFRNASRRSVAISADDEGGDDESSTAA